MIYTSYYANLKKIPKNIIPISISRITPKKINIKVFLQLAPSLNALGYYKQSKDMNMFIDRFFEENLNKLNAYEILNEINSYSKGKDVVLLCYEKAGDFCHRHLVSQWFRDNGIECEEYF